jgi:hypothetical protein
MHTFSPDQTDISKETNEMVLGERGSKKGIDE